MKEVGKVVVINDPQEMATTLVDSLLAGPGMMVGKLDDNTNVDMDTFGIQYVTVDGEEHMMVLGFEQVIPLVGGMIDWVERLHEEGRCGCEDSDEIGDE